MIKNLAYQNVEECRLGQSLKKRAKVRRIFDLELRRTRKSEYEQVLNRQKMTKKLFWQK